MSALQKAVRKAALRLAAPQQAPPFSLAFRSLRTTVRFQGASGPLFATTPLFPTRGTCFRRSLALLQTRCPQTRTPLPPRSLPEARGPHKVHAGSPRLVSSLSGPRHFATTAPERASRTAARNRPPPGEEEYDPARFLNKKKPVHMEIFLCCLCVFAVGSMSAAMYIALTHNPNNPEQKWMFRVGEVGPFRPGFGA